MQCVMLYSMPKTGGAMLSLEVGSEQIPCTAASAAAAAFVTQRIINPSYPAK